MNYLKNEEIKFNNVLVIDQFGQKLGIFETSIALQKAANSGLDLVCISENENTPVCKIMDFAKFKFQQSKKEKENKRKQSISGVSEMQISMTIMKHDMETKAKAVERLLEKSASTRVVMRLRGREVNLMENAKLKMVEFISICSSFSQIKKDIFIEGRDIKCILEKKK